MTDSSLSDSDSQHGYCSHESDNKESGYVSYDDEEAKDENVFEHFCIEYVSLLFLCKALNEKNFKGFFICRLKILKITKKKNCTLIKNYVNAVELADVKFCLWFQS